MTPSHFSDRTGHLMAMNEDLVRFVTGSTWAERQGQPGICDFMLGNPQERVHPDFVSALVRHSTPHSADWFAYKDNEQPTREHVARTLRAWRGLPFEADDIFMTNGAFAAISVVLTTLLNPGDEVIYISPPWFFYETLIYAAGGAPVQVRCHPETSDLDIDAIAAAITDRTRAIIVNSPNNPMGRIYPVEMLRALADVLARANEGRERPIAILSDEAYSRIVFDGHPFVSPSAVYPHTFVIYTYTKILLIPGQRIGYIALAPSMPDRAAWRQALFMAQVVTGYAFPNALMQYALPDIEALSIDVEQYQHKRDRVVDALREMGYATTRPEGTFYVMVEAPGGDESGLIEQLAARDVYCLPGKYVDLPGQVRLSLTATEDMIERALPAFEAVAHEMAAVPRG